MQRLALFDWLIIALYLSGMIGLSVYWGRSHKNQEDYFVGGRKLAWWAVGLSTMATQTSAISFISIPAFVALKPGGGFTWLQYELAVPLAIIAVMAFLVPFFRKLELVSVYEYLELRYSPSVRSLVSLIFLISRALATGVGIYASGIVLSVCLGTPLWVTILIIGVATIIYDTIGGMAAVVYSDVIQMSILVAGISICILTAVDIADGFGEVWKVFPETRRDAIDFSTGLGDGAAVPFWAFLLGGIFLYTSYYGTDQSQVQRELSAPTTADTKKSLVFNGFVRFPLTALYILLGVAIYAVYTKFPELGQKVPYDKPDYLVPQFVLLYLPPGLRGLLFAALLAAAMSSLDSALNSLSAATMHDFIAPRLRDQSRLLLFSKLTTVGWGIMITGFAFFVGSISDTVIEAINKIGSAFSGPILAAFLVGVIFRKVTARGIIAGIISGVVFNLYLWLGQPLIHWMWWNMFGFLVATAVSLLISRLFQSIFIKNIGDYVLDGSRFRQEERAWLPVYLVLGAYFILMVLLLLMF